MSLMNRQISETTSFTYSENGALCLKSSGNALVDLYSTIGALRNAASDRKIDLFEKAITDNKELATKILFYGRDIREGLGERDTFRTLLRHSANKHKEIIAPNINLIGFYGRFDDLYSLIDTACEDEMWTSMKEQFEMDLDNMKAGKPVSLLAKWIKTPDASSKETRKLGILTSQKLGYKNVAAFKKDLKALRKYLDIVEIKVSANSFDTIAYDKIPSNAMMKYRKLFGTKDGTRFSQFLDDVKSGKTEIKASTLYPYDITKKVLYNREDNDVLETQWNALPNYVDTDDNVLIMADTSGSMTCCNGLPISSSIGLAVYFAERNKGPFAGYYMTFSDKPALVKVTGDTLQEKMNLKSINCMNTNLDAAFQLILDTAIKTNTPAEQMPKALVVISDMQIDRCGSGSEIFYDKYAKKFEEAGYTIPNVVFWNVNSESDTFHADATRKGVQLVSGHSVTAFKNVLQGMNKTPLEAMLDVILSDRYAAVTIAA